MSGRIQRAQEIDGLEILASAVPVRHEVLLPPEVQVQHGSDGIDAQAVEVEFLQPVAGAGKQESAHFVPLVIEDQRAPVAVLGLARIVILVQCGAVEIRQPMCVAREMSRHPVEQHADAGLVTLVDELTQLIRGAVAAGGREVAGGLIAPGVIQRMLGDRQQFDVREAGIAHIRDQFGGEFAPGVEAPVVVAPPGAGCAPRRCSSARAASRAARAPRASRRRATDVRTARRSTRCRGVSPWPGRRDRS